MPLSQYPQEMSSLMLVTLLLMPVLFFGATSFWAPHSMFYHPKLARFINSRYGANALECFLVRLKPLLMFGVVGVLEGLTGFWHSRSTGATQGAYAIHGFFFSGGVGFALAHVVLYFRKAVGVFRTWTIKQPVSPARGATPERKTLRDALRIYWWALIGLAVFPAIVFIGGEFLRIPFEFFILPFFGVCFLTGWPFLSGRAPFSFWLVAGGVWLLGGIFAVILLQLIRALLA